MNISSLSVKRPISTIMVTFIFILLGIVSLTKIPIDLLPELEVPVVIVSTTYRGVGPREIEKLITAPVEEVLGTVHNIKNIRSTSNEGNSIVIAEFNFGTDMEFAALDMREKVDLIKGFLPKEASSPMVIKIDPNAMPIIEASLYGNRDLSELQKFSEDIIKPRLERIKGVASVDVSGGYTKEIHVVLDDDKVSSYGLSIDFISNILGAENLNLPGGQVKKGNRKLTIRTLGEFKSLEDIKNLPIPLTRGGIIYLNDIADINLTNKEVSSIARINGQNSMNISIQKQSGTNTVRVADIVNEEINKISEQFKDISIYTVLDQSKYIKKSINNVVESALYGAVLSILILYLFFRNLRSTLIIGTAIPISIIVTFSLLYFSGITLNIMTLGGLALGVGMLVDNAIVVLENIYRLRQEGFGRVEASIKGAKEVVMAVTASTLTTIAVFLPIVFVEGITSTLFRELALTVSFSLFASLIVSITLIPMLSSKILTIDRNKENTKKRLFYRVYITFDAFFEYISNLYKKLLNWSLFHRKTTVLIGILIFIVSMASIFRVGAEFFPEMDEGQFSIKVSLPKGSGFESTNEIVSLVEKRLEDIKDIDTIFSNIGGNGRFGTNSGSSNRATINVLTKNINERERDIKVIADEVRKKTEDIPGAKIEVEVSSTSITGGFGAPISISVKGDDLDILQKISKDFKTIIKSVEGTREVKTNYSEGSTELQILINRLDSSIYGLTSAQIAGSVKNNIQGRISTRYKLDGDEINVIVKGDKYYSESISNLESLPIKTPLGIDITLSEVASLEIAKGPSKINRDDQSRVITVKSRIIGRDLKSISNDINEKLKSYKMPSGYTYDIEGQNKELNEAFKDLTIAIILAILLVYMILASQFESLLHPFTIMLSVPLAFSGGALGLFITNRALSVPALIGAMMLAGIVVNDAIVLIDYINTRRKRGEDRLEAIKNAGPIRLRPILITTFTTVLGLLPLAIGLGEGGETIAPLATVVIGGLTLATLLTLVFIPVVYTIFDDMRRSRG